MTCEFVPDWQPGECDCVVQLRVSLACTQLGGVEKTASQTRTSPDVPAAAGLRCSQRLPTIINASASKSRLQNGNPWQLLNADDPLK